MRIARGAGLFATAACDEHIGGDFDLCLREDESTGCCIGLIIVTSRAVIHAIPAARSATPF